MLLAIIVSGCSGAGSPSVPQLPDEAGSASEPDLTTQSTVSKHGNHYLWSYNLVHVDASNSEEVKFEVIPARQVTDHWNVLGWLEQGPCFDCVEVMGIADTPQGTKLIDIQVTHPFPGKANLTGFDVRGIAMFDGSHSYPTLGKTSPDSSYGDGELMNADGYTALYHYLTQGNGPDGLQGYIEGSFASETAPGAIVNGFKRLVSPDPSNTRNAFLTGSVLEVTYDIDMPDSEFVFGYAVDASWCPPTTKPVTDPMTQFPPEANCPEPWKIDLDEIPIGNGLTDKGGQTVLEIAVWDYQGKDSHSDPVIECPELFDGTLTASCVWDSLGCTGYQVTVANTELAPAGSYKCLIWVEDNENSVAPEWLDLSAYQIYTFEVIDAPDGWARIWGWWEYDQGWSVAIDSLGDIYVVGSFMDTVDMDPGDDIDEHVSNGYDDPFLSKFDSSGGYQWTRTWGSSIYDQARGVAVGWPGNVYVTGYCHGETDFDPGPGIDIHTGSNSFLSKFDSGGDFQWARTWGTGPGSTGDAGMALALDGSGNIYVAGEFENTVDFDPGPGVVEFTSQGSCDAYVTSFDDAGVFRWAGAWGGGHYDIAFGVVAEHYGSVYVTGYFNEEIDFNPGPGTEMHFGQWDVFLSSFDSSGAFQWVRTWGGNGQDMGYSASLDIDGILVTGSFWDTVDFDPGSGTASCTSNGSADAYLTKFNADGEFIAVQVWGGANHDTCRGAAIYGSNVTYVTGHFSDTVDFDPGAGIYNCTAVGGKDNYLSKLDAGVCQWARAWGGSTMDEAFGVAVDSSGSAYVTGFFQDFADFNPDEFQDEYHYSDGHTDAFLLKVLPNGLW